MTTPPTNANPTLSLNLPAYDPAGTQINVAIKVSNVSTDPTTGIIYGNVAVMTTPSGTGVQSVSAVSGAFVSNSIVDLLSVKQLLDGTNAASNTLLGDINYGNSLLFTISALATALGINTIDALTTTAIAAGTAGNTIIKASAGTLVRVLITATGTNQMNIYDNATTNSGKVIGAIPASPSIGQVFELKMPAANGITVGGNSNNPGMTISWT